MKFFIDTANLSQIEEAQALGILDGVTTNPSLMAKEGITGEVNIINHYKAICDVVEGDVETAIQSYTEADSPNLVIIETDTTDESFTERLGELSAHCNEGTNAFIIGPTNDVNLYRSLTSMGVSDYLVRPVPLETLSEVVAKALIDKLGTSGSRLIGVIGAKGGVGTSSLTQGLAWGISEKLKKNIRLL